MDFISFFKFMFKWNNDFVLLIIPIFLIAAIGMFVLKQFDYRIKPLKSNIRASHKYISSKKVIMKNSGNEKLLTSLKEIINITIRSRSIISRINTEIQSLDRLIESKKIIKVTDVLIITQLYNSINNHRQELENRFDDIKYFLSDKALALVKKEQSLLLSAELKINEFINSYNDKLYLSNYSELVKRIDMLNKEIAGLYQNLTELFQEELSEEINN